MRLTVTSTTGCALSPTGDHYRVMDRLLNWHEIPHYRTTCEYCGARLRIEGAKWASESVVIHELDKPVSLTDP